ncbi:MAG: hypothetical protein AB8I58_22300 [Anaerolineales bacterium]
MPYLIGGSLASTLYGVLRTTQDSDIITEMHLEHLQSFVSALQNEFYIDDEMIEDAILSKLEWYRMGGEVSNRQWRDVLGVLKTRAGELDLAYMQKWANELKVEDLLDRALKEA